MKRSNPRQLSLPFDAENVSRGAEELREENACIVVLTWSQYGLQRRLQRLKPGLWETSRSRWPAEEIIRNRLLN